MDTWALAEHLSGRDKAVIFFKIIKQMYALGKEFKTVQ